ncbi:MAG TPA: right-handed parallel beta-helix repeat-containing protein [Nevskia sp.]|nr:right-handed parallel beta-helix repeat-containing protein [Nevskia sp.]
MDSVSKRWNARKLAAGVVAILAIVTGMPAAHAAGTTYYVDAVSGSDANAGTSPAAAWNSLANINATTFQPGDSILLRTGQKWTETVALAPGGSGAAGAPITLSSYGGGARPIIDASGIPGANFCVSGSTSGAVAVLLVNQQYWTIDGLEITNYASGNNINKGSVRAGICVVSNTTALKSSIAITNNYIHDVNSCFTCSGYYDGHYTGGIVFSAASGNYDDVYIANNTVQNIGRIGIVFGDGSNTSRSTRVTVRNNTLGNVDGDGIIVSGTEGAVIEQNVIAGAGLQSVPTAGNPESEGIWWSYTDHTTVQFNEVSGVRTHNFGGQGYDIDAHASNSKIQYNYSHDNEGGFLLLMGLGTPSPSKNAIVRYNLSVNDAFPGTPGEAIITTSYGITDGIEIQNNTLFVPTGSPARIMACSTSDGKNKCDAYHTGNWAFRNNIVYDLGTTGDYQPVLGGTYQTNLFYGTHPASEPAEADKLTFDPMLAAPGGSAPAGYQLQAGSPAIGVGTAQPQNGGVDYFGNVLSATAAPSVGFHEGGAFAGPPALLDGANDFLALARASSNVALDTATPSYFNGDASRLTKSGSSPGNITWLFEGMTNFSAAVYLRQCDPSVVTFWASPDGRSFTQVATSNTAPQATAGSWSATTFTPAASLPAGTAFLMVTLDPPPPYLTSSPKAELGQISITR